MWPIAPALVKMCETNVQELRSKLMQGRAAQVLASVPASERDETWISAREGLKALQDDYQLAQDRLRFAVERDRICNG